MSRSDDYRAKAEECRRMAAKSLHFHDKEAWLKLAADWLTLIAEPGRAASDRFDTMECYLGTGQSKSERKH
jgi:hypothetical protein